MARRRNPNQRRYPRTARLNVLLQEIVAGEIEQLDDDRIGMVTVTGIDCDADLRRAIVYLSSFTTAGSEEEVEMLEALDESRYLIQRSVASQVRLKRTPELVFEADETARSAARIEGIIADLAQSEDRDTDGTAVADDTETVDDTAAHDTASDAATGPDVTDGVV